MSASFPLEPSLAGIANKLATISAKREREKCCRGFGNWGYEDVRLHLADAYI